MGHGYKQVQTCAEHGFALSPDGTCIRCAREETSLAGRATAVRLAIGGAFVLALVGIGAAWAHVRASDRAIREGPGAAWPPTVAERSLPPSSAPPPPRAQADDADGAPPAGSSSARHDVLKEWEAERARVEAKRAAELAEEAIAQEAAEKRRFDEAYRLPDAGQPVAAPVARSRIIPYEGWPSLTYAGFLADSSDRARRERFWPLFHQAEAEAQAFATSREQWVPIIRVEYGAQGTASGDWTTSGVIQMKPDKDAGLMFHEIFHPAFHKSEFHVSQDDRDGAWSEAFCDAFRYYAERQLLPEPRSGWVRRLDRLTTMTESQALADTSFSRRKYTYPASVIVKRVGGPSGSMASLRALWFQLIVMRRQTGTTVMDQFFGFAPPLHKED